MSRLFERIRSMSKLRARVAVAMLWVLITPAVASAQLIDLAVDNIGASVVASGGCLLEPSDLSWELEVTPSVPASAVTTTDAVFIRDILGTYYDASGSPIVGSAAPVFLATASISALATTQTLVFPADYAPVALGGFVAPTGPLGGFLVIEVRVDYLDSIAESDEGNNTETGGALATTGDLSFMPPVVGPAAISAGFTPSPVDFGWTTTFLSTSVIPWNTAIYLKGDGIYLDASGAQTGVPTAFATIDSVSFPPPAGGVFVFPMDFVFTPVSVWPAPSPAITSYSVEVVLDPFDSICEPDETNNTVEFPVTLTGGAGADLSATDVALTSAPTCGTGYCPGDVIDIEYTVSAGGGGGSPGVWREMIFLSSTQSAPTTLASDLPSYALIHCENGVSLTGTRSLSITIPEIDAIGGLGGASRDLYLSVYLDGSYAGTSGDPFDIPEVDESNNWTSSATNYPFFRGSEPDLVPELVGSLSLLPVGPGDQIQFEYTVQNIGTESTEINSFPSDLIICVFPPGLPFESEWQTAVVWLPAAAPPPVPPFGFGCAVPGSVWQVCSTRSGPPLGGMAPAELFEFNSSVPIGFATGDYNVFIIVDTLGTIGEGELTDPAELNNVYLAGTVTVLPTLPPDLRIVDGDFFAASSLSLEPCGQFELEYQVENIGGPSIGPWSASYTLVSTTDPTVQVSLGSEQIGPPVPAVVGPVTITSTLDVPCLDIDSYRMAISVNTQFDSDPSNDDALSTDGLSYSSDLDMVAIAGAVSQPAAVLGDVIEITWRDVALGSTEPCAGVSWVDRVELLQNGVFVGGEFVSVTAPPLPFPVDGVEASASLTIPPGATPGVPMTIRITPNALGNLCEPSVFQSATIVLSIDIASGTADLQFVASQVSPAVVETGDAVFVSWSAENNGDVTTNRPSWTDSVYLSTTDDLSGVTQTVGSRTHFGHLDVGAGYDTALTFNVPSDADGSLWVVIALDAVDPGQVLESDEANNVQSFPISVTQVLPDLSIDSVTVTLPSYGAIFGQEIDVEWTRQSSGSALDGNTVTESIFLSTNPALDAGDVLLASFVEGTDSLGSAGSTTILLPTEGSAGDYYVIVQTDSSDSYVEVSESNNDLASAVVSVAEATESDLIVDCIDISLIVATIGDALQVPAVVKNLSGTANGRFDIALSLRPENPGIDPIWNPLGVGEGAFLSDPESLLIDDTIDLSSSSGNEINAPVLEEGIYDLIARTDIDGRFPESDETNNDGFDSCITVLAKVDLRAALLNPQVGSPPVSVPLDNDYRVYKVINTAIDQTLEVRVEGLDDGTGAPAVAQIFGAVGFIPQPDTAEFTSELDETGVARLRIPDTIGATYYFHVRTFGVDSGSTVDVFAEYLDFAVDSVTPGEIGQSGPVTLTIRGAGFPSGIDDDDVWLRPVSDPTQFFLPLPGAVDRVGSTEIRATFDLLGADLGQYEAVVRIPAAGPPATGVCSAPACAFASLLVAPTVVPGIELALGQPVNVRASSFVLLDTLVTNTGNIDAPYAVISLRSPLVSGRELVTGSVPLNGVQSFGADAEVLCHTVVLRSVPPAEPVRLETVFAVESPIGGVTLVTDQLDLYRSALSLSAEEFAAWQEERAAATFAAIGGVAPAPWSGLTLSEWIADWRDALDIAGVLPGSVVAGALPSATPLSSGLCPSTERSIDFDSFLDQYYDLSETAPMIPADFPAELIVTLDHAVAQFATVESCTSIPIFAAIDPNEKTTGSGVGASRYVGLGQRIPYTIFYENVGGSSPAARVEIRDRLPDDLTLASVRFGDISLGDLFVDVPPGQLYYSGLYTPEIAGGLTVRAIMSVDPAENEVVWTLEAIDPSSGLPPTDATVGWLPPGAGGAVTFSVLTTFNAGGPPRPIDNRANIVFDGNTPVITDPAHNTLDPNGPVFDTATAVIVGGNVEVSWSAADDVEESGVESFAVIVSEAGIDPVIVSGAQSPVIVPLVDPAELSTVTIRAVDRVGNVSEEIVSFDEVFLQRGDCNSDGSFDISDPVFLLGQLFIFGSPATECRDACDANDDGGNDISDSVYMLGALFVSGSPQPEAPFPDCGADPTVDTLDCVFSGGCP